MFLDKSATAIDRSLPWRRLSTNEDPEATTNTFIEPVVGKNGKDPHLHHIPLTAANFSGSYHKPSEYMGDYATTTKPEENPNRTNVRDLFVKSSSSSEATKSKDEEDDNDPSVSRL